MQIGAYGEGEKPVIDGRGAPAALRLRNCAYIELADLELRNTAHAPGDCSGLAVTAGGEGCRTEVLRHTVLRRLTVRQVNGRLSRGTAGLIITVEPAAAPCRFDGLTVEDCDISDTGSCGIILNSVYGKRPEIASWDIQPLPFTPCTGVVIRRCRVHDLPGDGMWISTTKGAVLEYNTVYNTSYGELTQYAGMWPHNSDGCVMQFNELYENRLGAGDGQGLDVDINCNDTLIQYNYIHASIFKSAVPGVFEISWSETLDGEYTPFTASDIKYTREKIGDDYVPGDPENEAIGNQYLAYYNIENIPAQARYIKLFFKGSDPEAEYPFNYANWQAPLGYLKVEAYKKTVDIEENKTLTDAATGIRVTGDLPKGAELVVIDKSESGVKNALAAYLQNPAVKDYQNALSMVEIRIMVGGEVYTDFEKPLIVAFPVKEQVAGAAYYAMTYDMDIDKFTPIAGEAVDGYYQMETTWTGDFVLLGNDKAAEGFGPVDPGSKEESSDNGGAPDTGRAFPAAALLVLAGAAGAVLALRKRKS